MQTVSLLTTLAGASTEILELEADADFDALVQNHEFSVYSYYTTTGASVSDGETESDVLTADALMQDAKDLLESRVAEGTIEERSIGWYRIDIAKIDN